MSTGRDVANVPATERVVVGLCHGLNDQLAAVSAYTYLLQRRGELGEMVGALQGHLDRLAHSVRLIRSLIRDAEPEFGPVALSVLAESATELMEAFPEGGVVFRPKEGYEARILRVDWARALRSLLLAGAWASRDVDETVVVELSARDDDDGGVVRAEAIGELPEPGPRSLEAESGSSGIRIEAAATRAAEISFPGPREAPGEEAPPT